MITIGSPFPRTLTVKKIHNHVAEDFSTDVLSKGTHVLFAVPGAFTPTCSNLHVPSFIESFDALKNAGIDTVFCLAVNDPFVMEVWAKSFPGGEKIHFLCDGNGEITKALGTLFDGSGAGLGHRSLRYSMMIKDGAITKLFVEKSPGICTVSSGASLINALIGG